MLTGKVSAEKITKTILTVTFILIGFGFSGCREHRIDGHGVRWWIRELENEDKGIRSKAAINLGHLRDKRAVEPLIEALRDCYDAGELTCIVRGLISIGTPAVKSLIEVIDDSMPWVRRNAAYALGEIKDTSAVEALCKALESTDIWVRRRAAESLGKIKDLRAVDPLIVALTDEDLEVRRNTVMALRLIKDNRSTLPLTAMLNEGDEKIRIRTAQALGLIRDSQAVPYLIDALKDKAQGVRKEAAAALVSIGDQSAVEPLIDVLNNDEEWRVRLASAVSLGKLGDERAIEHLIQALKDSDRRVILSATDALNTLCEPEEDLGSDYEVWCEWWEKNKSRF
ncbi:HEAT repeat domain-containing protein [candidate division WOR-3 bacterium]|nr:HEAT repeat domain-containing protein [candidate division WOR-3 bacterium]